MPWVQFKTVLPPSTAAKKGLSVPWIPSFFFFSEMDSHCLAHAGLKLKIFLL